MCCALRGPYQRDNLCWLRCQSVRELFVKADQVVDVDIAEVSLEKSILSELISAALLL